ncbi:C2 family cysteine protease [Actinomadura macrotermitis]|uniref:Calpain catalytic domain-containing protein n=1 Tax=Actinomadura macrotermitis TaxID=2585200 RepID=A0A7K0BU34_9ACTN|nr:C2 family cysteine protease [Actinomadura macrotermitis]MQY04679.1 hypothetical protein [Actinomadura macrotermitis]
MRTADRGEGAVSYIAVILLIAGIAAAVTLSGVGDTVAGGIEAGICKVAGRTGCAEPAAHEGQQPNPPSQQEWGNRNTDPDKPPPKPTDAETRKGKEAADKVRKYLDSDCAWYQFFGCDKPQSPKDVLSGMSPGEINALFAELSDDEIRRLLKEDGVVGVLKVRADASLLHHLERVAPKSIDPDFTDVRDHGKKPSNPATDYGTVPNGQLFGTTGEPSLTDINQGGIGDCWWLASMGALSQTPAGREQIKNMIRQNPNGTYTVTFPDGEKVTVTPYFPIDKNGSLSYASPAGQPPVVWPLVLEKALAAKRGSYGKLVSGDGGDGMKILTGKSGESKNPKNVSQEQLQKWLDSGAGVTLLTPDSDKVGGKPIYEGPSSRLHADHVYVVKGITKDGKVELYNPWGYDHATITMEEFHKYFEDVDMNPIK